MWYIIIARNNEGNKKMKEQSCRLSYEADVRYIPASGKKLNIVANDEELAFLTERFKIPAVTSFRAEVALERGAGGQIRLSGRFHGTVVQVCGVTLEEFEQPVDDTVDIVFCEEQRASPKEKEYVVEMQEAFEPIENGKIPVGEILTECFSLAIDPFPRKKDAQFAFENDAPERENPFAALAGLKLNQKKE